MAGGESYYNSDIPLDVVTSESQRQAVVGAEPGTPIFGVAIVQHDFAEPALPVGAELKLYFGPTGDEILLSGDLVAFAFDCGHDTGIYFSNGAALVGKKIRLLLTYTGGMVQYAR